MPASSAHSSDTIRPKSYFATTHWSVVLAAGHGDTMSARESLEKLCRTYWYPLYAHVRRRGHSPEDAKDLTQDFFARLLDGNSLANADPGRGRFRSFMLGAMNHCLADTAARQRAQKRGGGRAPVSLDLITAEQQFELEARNETPPDLAFDQQWARALLNQVLGQLENEYRDAGKAALFAALQRTLIGSRESQPYTALAAELNLNEGAVRTAVHRLRKRYRELVRQEIAQTVSSPEEMDEEMRYLFRVSLGG